MAKANKKTEKKDSVSDMIAAVLKKVNAPGQADVGTNGPVVTITDFYSIGNSGNSITFDLVFNNKGVGALTDATLHRPNLDDKELLNGGRDSQMNILVGKDNDLDVTTLNVKSVVAATEFTTVPAPLKVVFTLKGGKSYQTFTIPARKFNKVGDIFILDFTITLFQS